MEFSSARFTRTARRNRIATCRARHAIDNPYVIILQPPDQDHPNARLILLGDDDRGIGLAVGEPVIDKVLLVIHVQPITQQPRHRRLYDIGKELQQWTTTL